MPWAEARGPKPVGRRGPGRRQHRVARPVRGPPPPAPPAACRERVLHQPGSPRSPAPAAGVRRGDFVTEINGTKIIGVVDFQQSLYYFSGSQVPVKFFRDGKDVTVMLKIEERPAAANRN